MAEIVDFGLQQHKIKMDSRYFENVLSVVAGDTGRRIEVQLLDTNGMVQDTTGLNLRLNAVIEGKATYTDATLVDAATGKYQLDLSNGMFLAPGNWQFQWQITDSAGKKLHSFAFTGNIGKNISEGGSQATNFYLNLEDLKAMQEDFISGAFDSAVLETNIAERLEAKETEYAPQLAEVTAQLAQTKNTQQVLGTQSKSYDSNKKRFVSFITDDAARRDYTVFKDIFVSKGVPCATGVVRNFVGTGSYASLAEIKELQDVYGWEILSHTANHRRLADLTDAEIETEILSNKEWLEANGLGADNICYPYGSYDERVKRIAKKYHRSGRTSSRGIGYNTSPIGSHELVGLWIGSDVSGQQPVNGFEVNTLEHYTSVIDQVYDNGGWLIISFHSWQLGVDTDILPIFKQVIDYAKSKCDVVTPNEALNQIGNTLEIGTTSKLKETDSKFLTVGYDGEVILKDLRTKYYALNHFDGLDEPSAFKDKTTSINQVNSQAARDSFLPEGIGGTLITVKNEDLSPLYNYQFYIPITKNQIYKRFGNADRTWDKWDTITQGIKELDGTKITSTSGYSSFPSFISVSIIPTLNATGFPENLGGTLKTYNYSSDKGYVFQEYDVYGSSRRYKRNMDANGVWQSWALLSAPVSDKVNTANSATIDANYKGFIMLNNYTAATTITDISGGLKGQEITLYTTNSNVSIQHDLYKLRLKDEVNFTVPRRTAIKFVKVDTGLWAEVSRTSSDATSL